MQILFQSLWPRRVIVIVGFQCERLGRYGNLGFGPTFRCIHNRSSAIRSYCLTSRSSTNGDLIFRQTLSTLSSKETAVDPGTSGSVPLEGKEMYDQMQRQLQELRKQTPYRSSSSSSM
jgi:hypothetical protein